MRQPIHIPKGRGFTLIEVMVSVLIFSIVMTVALSALLAMSQSDARAESYKSVINNLNFALDTMTRTIRTGYNYHCGTGGSDLSTPGPQDCSGAGQSYLGLRAGDGTLVAYCLSGGAIRREVLTSGTLDTNCASSNFSPLTSNEITISNLQFIVIGACPKSGIACSSGDSIQPKVAILLSGQLQVTPTQKTTFNLQSSVTQRVYDQ